MNHPLAGWKDKILFTPGPLTTSRTVKQAMLRDLGSRDFEFIATVRAIRERLVALAGAKPGEYEAIPLQGSGTYAVEAVLTSTVPHDGKVLVVINGAYGQRMVRICAVAGVACCSIEFSEDTVPDLHRVEQTLSGDPAITHLAIVHCETTTGIMNPIRQAGELAHRYGKRYFVDAMSSFGAVPIDAPACEIDYLVSSANKCIEGVPGFGFVIARRKSLLETEGCARSLSLDLLNQWRGLEANGQFRFTPPTHALLAFHQALAELEAEGGVTGRAARYAANHRALIEGMRAMGFEEYLAPELQGPIITSFRYPKHPNFTFEEFYRRLNERDYVIYPGKVSNADCFRIGHIGRIFEADIRALLAAIRETMADMGIELPLGK
ncbi:MAG TPA: 2-aminoethylphosphonate--pyruvate transaminase [Candidatus Hydrogenedentes bacterium]|mgnify:CR=1 FL=1|nr:2-aminoethylphosphonate--pyruvate transaminase [Candidatus Hydrogenedentota bacterium]HOT49435.1 2-aminoethylphosphonate--pyruvate transaminase [Candidatus Hydrogenedentota bacterium]HOV75293.1 2-aminoethylphosphonate--pyruvate transaminase [Candidatus Hydrogenedentota bacterium]HRT22057.1 2-aminoethylphosphonate--pyruvate transaminase [Candidatus Hydrogenedentota bacterium]HRT64712.1 2-aminoethylphosphonate--pyruvate transaminase [Candidatus Hydrogenedentota bacterium]